MDIYTYLDSNDPLPERKRVLGNFLRLQLQHSHKNPGQRLVILGKVSELLFSKTAKQLMPNYLPYRALDLAGNLELPEHHRGGVTWEMLAETINAIPNDGAPGKVSEDDIMVIYDPTVPLAERRRTLGAYLHQMLQEGNEHPEDQTDTAYHLAGMLGSATHKDMKEDHNYYLCLEMANGLAHPDTKHFVGDWNALQHFIKNLPD